MDNTPDSKLNIASSQYMKHSNSIDDLMNCMKENDCVMVHLEFEFGDEEKPHFSFIYPVTIDAALFAILVTCMGNER